MRRHLLLVIVAIAALGVSIPVAEARPRAAATPASCTVSGSTVAASGLPTDQVINFMVNDNAGTWGWVLGFTPDGAWSVSVPATNGPTGPVAGSTGALPESEAVAVVDQATDGVLV